MVSQCLETSRSGIDPWPTRPRHPNGRQWIATRVPAHSKIVAGTLPGGQAYGFGLIFKQIAAEDVTWRAITPKF